MTRLKAFGSACLHWLGIALTWLLGLAAGAAVLFAIGWYLYVVFPGLFWTIVFIGAGLIIEGLGGPSERWRH
jgi:hypothetical protein